MLKDLEEVGGAMWIFGERERVCPSERIAGTKAPRWDTPGVFREQLGGQCAWSEGGTGKTAGNKVNKRVLRTMKGFWFLLRDGLTQGDFELRSILV